MLQSNTARLLFRTILLMLLIAGLSTAYGQDLADEASTEAQSADERQEATQPTRAIEEITVTAEQSFFLLRAQIEAAEEALYSTYNEYNDVDEFKVDCRRTNWSDTYIQEQQCWPKFFDRIVADNAQMFRITGNFDVIAVNQLVSLHADRFEALRANILRVAQEHPEVAEALLRKARLEQNYQEQREACMEKDPVLFLFRKCP